MFSVSDLAGKKVTSLFPGTLAGSLKTCTAHRLLGKTSFIGLGGKDGKVPKHSVTLRLHITILQVITD